MSEDSPSSTSGSQSPAGDSPTPMSSGTTSIGEAVGGTTSIGDVTSGTTSIGEAVGGTTSIGEAVSPSGAGVESSTSPAAAPRKRRGVIGLVAIVIVALVAGVVTWVLTHGSTVPSYKVGDCLASEASAAQAPKDLPKVDCAADKAAFKVVGVVSSQRLSDFNVNTTCAAYRTAINGVWIGTNTSKGTVYCLESIDRGLDK